ncbi:MAG TPA: hypothetical protein VF665_13630 [Longimicrobium sp.]|jgi:hypothetical protein|uniref:hypothetical protein n=1 Tax=Longimicrobium sp. TaxID=2029185 RepID=UPI002EDA53E9
MNQVSLARRLLPYPPLFWRIARTTVVLWAAFHVALAVLGVVVPAPPASAVIVAVCAAAVWMDLARGDHLFFSNLGVSPGWSAWVAVAVGCALEVPLQIALRLLIVPA